MKLSKKKFTRLVMQFTLPVILLEGMGLSRPRHGDCSVLCAL